MPVMPRALPGRSRRLSDEKQNDRTMRTNMPVRKAGWLIKAAFSFMVKTPGKRIISTQPRAPKPNIMPKTPLIQPLLPTPEHGSLPSGHATEAFFVARMLSHLAGHRADQPKHQELDNQLQRLATRIANNRIISGVHFHIDSVAGRMVGETLAEYLIYRCDPSSDGWKPRCFDGTALVGDEPMLQRGLDRTEAMDGSKAQPYFQWPGQKPHRRIRPPLSQSLVTHSGQAHEAGLLNLLWHEAASEWR